MTNTPKPQPQGLYQCHPYDEVTPKQKLIRPSKALSLGHISAILEDLLKHPLSDRQTTQIKLVKQSIDHLLRYRCARTKFYHQNKGTKAVIPADDPVNKVKFKEITNDE